MTVCINGTCPFEDCSYHPGQLKGMPRGDTVSVMSLDAACRRYIGGLVDKMRIIWTRIKMVAVEFCEESTRMCKTYPSCSDCPAKLDDGVCGLRCSRYDYAPDKKVAIVEQWAKDHPRKTRQSEFLKQWPNVAVSESGVIKIRPCNLDVNAKKECLGVTCDYCRREFWMQEVE